MPIKEIVDDAEGLVLVTVKGTLIVKRKGAVTLAVLCATNLAWADKPAEPASDPDPRIAIKDRGIVLMAPNKRNLLVVVPSDAALPKAAPAGSTLTDATIYFGDAKTLFALDTGGVDYQNKRERRNINDPRQLWFASVIRSGTSYTLECEDMKRFEKRAFALTPPDASTLAVEKVSVRPFQLPYRPALLARLPGTTTYLFVDSSTVRDSQEFRLYLGKRGSMKQLAVKESARDSKAIVIVSTKGVLTVNLEKGHITSATWGSAKKPGPIDLVPVEENRFLIFRELGVYTRDRTGHPCDEL